VHLIAQKATLETHHGTDPADRYGVGPTRRIARGGPVVGGAIAPWSMFGLAVMPQVVAEFGVRTWPGGRQRPGRQA
jgi:hypothetical protein